MAHSEIRRLSINDLADEVDPRYPTTLHTIHNSYQLAPERLTIKESMRSPLQKQFPKPQREFTTKLAPHIMAKRNYVVQYRNLKYYLAQGLEVTKIHRILTFKQSPLNLTQGVVLNQQQTLTKIFTN